VKVSYTSSTNKQIGFCIGRLRQGETVIVSGFGQGIPKAIMIAEILKERLGWLHQMNKLATLTKIVPDRQTNGQREKTEIGIRIQLSKEEKGSGDIGYQKAKAPIDLIDFEERNRKGGKEMDKGRRGGQELDKGEQKMTKREGPERRELPRRDSKERSFNKERDFKGRDFKERVFFHNHAQNPHKLIQETQRPLTKNSTLSQFREVARRSVRPSFQTEKSFQRGFGSRGLQRGGRMNENWRPQFDY